MRTADEQAARLFSVVGAPYIAERHAEICDSEESRELHRSATQSAKLAAPCLAGWWLRDED